MSSSYDIKGRHREAIELLADTLRTIAASLETPVVAFLLLLTAAVIFMFGTIVVEYFTSHLKLKAAMPQLVDRLRDEKDTAAVIRSAGLLKRQVTALTELTKHPQLTNTAREALAVQLVTAEREHYDSITKVTDMIAKLGPMFGLLGTLIPLGPGVIALGRGDTFTLSTSLLVAFDTTIAGLIVAAVAVVISTIRKKWYVKYMTSLELAAECVLEATNDGSV